MIFDFWFYFFFLFYVYICTTLRVMTDLWYLSKYMVYSSALKLVEWSSHPTIHIQTLFFSHYTKLFTPKYSNPKSQKIGMKSMMLLQYPEIFLAAIKIYRGNYYHGLGNCCSQGGNYHHRWGNYYPDPKGRINIFT